MRNLRTPFRASRVVGALVFAATAMAGPARADELVFTSNRDEGIFQLFRMAAEGGPARRVTALSMQAAQVTASPDGQQVAFLATIKSQPDLYIADLASGALRQLTSDSALETMPRWLPDGQRLVFQSFRDRIPKLYVVNADGTGLRRLTDSVAGEESRPSVSPDGRQVAYVLTTGRRASQIRTVDLATGKSVAVGSEPADAQESSPAWSPNGQQIAYTRGEGESSHLMLARVDGTRKQALTSGKNDRYDLPQWSPDGSRIAYLSMKAPSKRQSVSVMNADGSQVQEVSGGDEEHLSVAWSPAGDRLLFVKFHQGRGQIFSRGLGAAEPTRLSQGAGYELEFTIASPPRATQTAQAR